MNYPLITEYIEAIKAAEDNLDVLNYLRPVLGEDGEPIMSSGNFAVVFKMKDVHTGKLHAVKCFLKEQEGRAEAYRLIADEMEFVNSPYLTHIKYLDKELFVDTNATDEMEFPVLLMDWIEGLTLDKFIHKHIYDEYELSRIAYQFSRLAMWLMPQPFAHGDLKPDNILVKEDGSLVLVDYDGMYVPAMKGQKARELGSPDFRHPSRTEEVFDEHIDDFSLASILLSLKAISLQPSLLEEYGASDRLLFSEKDYRNLSESTVMDALKPLMQDSELISLYSLFILALSQNNLSQVSFRLFNLSRPQVPIPEDINGYLWYIKRTGVWTDEYGVKYSADKKFLISAPNEIKEYAVPKGTKYIASNAFINCRELCSISLPNTLEVISNIAFLYCVKLSSVTIPKSVKEVGQGAFEGCFSLTTIVVDKGNLFYDSRNNCNAIIETQSNTLISGCSATVIPNSITKIGKSSFNHCNTLKTIIIPNNIIEIDDYAFSECYNLEKIIIPKSVRKIGNKAFDRCQSLYSVTITNGVEDIGCWAFAGCRSLTSIVIPKSINKIGKDLFLYCEKLTTIHIPYGEMGKFKSLLPRYKDLLVEQDENNNLSTEVTEGDLENAWTDEFGVMYSKDRRRLLGTYTSYLSDYEIPEGTMVICDDALNGIWQEIEGLMISGNIKIPSTVQYIGRNPFRGDYVRIECESPYFIVEDDALYTSDRKELITCFSKKSEFTIPEGVERIRNFAFYDCEMSVIMIPASVTDIGDNPFIEMNLLNKQSLKVICNSPSFFVKNNALYKRTPQKLISYFGRSSYLFVEEETVIMGAYAFWSNSPKSIYLPFSMRTISEEALYGSCFSLQNLLIPLNTLNRYERLLPNYSEELLEVDLALISIDDSGTIYDEKNKRLLNGGNQKNYVINEGTKEIYKHAFSDCTVLTRLVLPASIKTIGKEAFMGCKNLKSISIPNSVSYIGEGAFKNCDKLENIEFPNSITSLEELLFDWCTNLTHVVIPNSVVRIGNWAFENCKSLKSISIPSSVRTFGDSVFFGCDNLTTIFIPIGTIKKFEILLPNYKDKLIEIDEEKESSIG